MSMPLCSAFTPLALEMMMGRLPVAAGSATPSDAGSAPKSLGVPATAVPAREVMKNLRRDHKLMGASLELAGPIYSGECPVASEEGTPGCFALPHGSPSGQERGRKRLNRSEIIFALCKESERGSPLRKEVGVKRRSVASEAEVARRSHVTLPPPPIFCKC